MGKRLERFDEIGIVDDMNGFELDIVKKTESIFGSTTPDVGAVIYKRTNWGLVYI